jgi:hypothetical protein
MINGVNAFMNGYQGATVADPEVFVLRQAKDALAVQVEKLRQERDALVTKLAAAEKDQAALTKLVDEMVRTIRVTDAVEVLTLVQDVTDLSYAPVARADEALAQHLRDGWTVLNIAVTSVANTFDHLPYTQHTRVVTLHRPRREEAPPPPMSPRAASVTAQLTADYVAEQAAPITDGAAMSPSPALEPVNGVAYLPADEQPAGPALTGRAREAALYEARKETVGQAKAGKMLVQHRARLKRGSSFEQKFPIAHALVTQGTEAVIDTMNAEVKAAFVNAAEATRARYEQQVYQLQPLPLPEPLLNTDR